MAALLLLLVSMAAPADTPNEAQKELTKLQGVWKLKTMSSRGAERTGPGIFGGADRYTLVIVGDRYVFSSHGGTLTLDPSKHAIDLVATEGFSRGRTMQGIYELKDNSLRLAYSSRTGNRPTELKSDRGSSATTVYTFERDAQATKEQAAEQLKQRLAALERSPGGLPFAGPSTTDLLKQVIERLDRIEKRLDAIEKGKK